MDEIFSNKQSYTPVAYINSPRRNGRNTIVATKSDEKSKESLVNEIDKRALLKPRPTISLVMNKFSGPANKKSRETDIFAMLTKRSSLPTIKTIPDSINATDSQSLTTDRTPITVIESPVLKRGRRLTTTKLKNLMSKNSLNEHLS